MSGDRPSPDSGTGVPPLGVGTRFRGDVKGRGRPPYSGEGGGTVKLIKRFAIAVGSLAALVLAGGAHMRF